MSADDRCDLESLFQPPPGLTGTHLLLCGLSADSPTLERIMSAFTNEPPTQRRASGLVRGLLMLDASQPYAEAQPAAGLLRLASCPATAWASRTALLHAKVALMGFGASRGSAADRWRLVVSTGNWTTATWNDQAQIDLFWTTDWCAKDANVDQDVQALTDIGAALSFFERLLVSLFASSHRALADAPLTVGWLDQWRKRLARTGGARRCKPQFIHSLDDRLVAGMRDRFDGLRASTLVAGSGFFEADDRQGGTPAALDAIESLGRASTRYLVFNAECAGAIASWASADGTIRAQKDQRAASEAGGWLLCRPRDPLETSARRGRRFLHAKFVAGLQTVHEDSARLVFLYLGSGNLSRRGILSRARLDGTAGRQIVGNVEAGVALRPDERIDRVWQRLACGDYAFPMSQALQAGVEEDGGDLFAPRDPPPLHFLRECAGGLRLVRSDVEPIQLWLQRTDGDWLAVPVDASVVALGAPPYPPFVRMRLSAPGDASDIGFHDVPVLSREGFLCRRPPPRLAMDGVLEALAAFPNPPPDDSDEEDEPPSRRAFGASLPPRRDDYPLRTLAVLIEAIAQRQSRLMPDEFPYWLAQLRCLLLEQVADDALATLRTMGVDLFDALHMPGFAPPWLDAHPELHEQYRVLVRDLRVAWCLPNRMAGRDATLQEQTNGA